MQPILLSMLKMILTKKFLMFLSAKVMDEALDRADDLDDNKEKMLLTAAKITRAAAAWTETDIDDAIAADFEQRALKNYVNGK